MFSIQQGQNFQFATPEKDLGVVNLNYPEVSFFATKYEDLFFIVTDSISITYNPTLPVTDGGIVVHRKGAKADFACLSEKDSFNLGGVIPALDNCDGNRRYAEQNDITSAWHYHNTPDGILSRRGVTVLKHTPDSLSLYNGGDRFDELYVLAYGTNYRRAFLDFYSLAGAIPMLPQWAFGFIYSRWKDYTEADYKEIVHRFREERLPLDAIMLDMCWHTDYWYGYRYDTANFPNMKEFLAWTETQHLKTGFNHHSGCIYALDPDVKEFCERAGLDYESSLVPGPSWETERMVVEYDTKNERHFKAFYDTYLTRLIDDGLDFHWVDGANSIYSSELYQRYLSEQTALRPVVLNRQHSDVLCNHRYPFGFSGDTYATWNTMRYTLENTIKGANNGVYWSHDIGGYMPQGKTGTSPDGEMFARWFQLGAFSPIMRAHAKKDVYWWPPVLKAGDRDGGSRLPWDWGENVLSATRTAMQLRAALIPYIYTMSRYAHDYGVPLCRGLYVDYPTADDAYRYDEYMFGDNILVAPVLNPSGKGEKAEATRSLWLPEGAWYDYFTGEIFTGNNNISVSKPLHEIPLYVKAGSLIPMTPYREYGSAPIDTLCLVAYPPMENDTTIFRLYEDDGQSFDYRNNKFRWTTLTYEHIKDISHKVVVAVPKGSYDGSVTHRAYRLTIINSSQPKKVLIAGKPVSQWNWDVKTRSIIINVPQQKVTKLLTIEIEL
jgi:alpha-glucosidase (family GH31 glycosyl hydrolase)